MRESQRDLIFRATTGGTGWPGPLGEVWEAWAGLLLAGNTFLARFLTCIKILSQIQHEIYRADSTELCFITAIYFLSIVKKPGTGAADFEKYQ